MLQLTRTARSAQYVNFATNGAKEMESGLVAGVENAENSGVGFVDISTTLESQGDFISLVQYNLTGFSLSRLHAGDRVGR